MGHLLPLSSLGLRVSGFLGPPSDTAMLPLLVIDASLRKSARIGT